MHTDIPSQYDNCKGFPTRCRYCQIKVEVFPKYGQHSLCELIESIVPPYLVFLSPLTNQLEIFVY